MAVFAAAVTCDIEGSSRYSTSERKAVGEVILNGMDLVNEEFGDDIRTPISFRVTEGDEFQFVVAAPERSYEILVFYRSVAASANFEPKLSFRASIGIGEIAVDKGLSSYAWDGEAFHHSRDGMTSFSKDKFSRRRRTKIITGGINTDSSLDVVLMYQDMIEREWTRAQWQAIRWRIRRKKLKDIAAKLDVSYQSVQKRIRAARWEEFSEGLSFIENRLLIHPH